MQSGGKNFNHFPENQLNKFCASTGVTDPIDLHTPPQLNYYISLRCGAVHAVRYFVTRCGNSFLTRCAHCTAVFRDTPVAVIICWYRHVKPHAMHCQNETDRSQNEAENSNNQATVYLLTDRDCATPTHGFVYILHS